MNSSSSSVANKLGTDANDAIFDEDHFDLGL